MSPRSAVRHARHACCFETEILSERNNPSLVFSTGITLSEFTTQSTQIFVAPSANNKSKALQTASLLDAMQTGRPVW